MPPRGENSRTFILLFEYVTVFQMATECPLVELTFKVPRYRIHCAKWFKDKSPDTIADALAFTGSAYAAFQRMNANPETWNHRDELRELDAHYQNIISGMDENLQKCICESPKLVSCSSKQIVQVNNNFKITQPSDEQIDIIIRAIHSYHDVKKRYPKTMIPLKPYMCESQWISLQYYKDQYRDILQLVCPNS